VEEERSGACRSLRRAKPAIAVWALTRTELTSAVRRLAREGLLRREDVISALRRVRLLEQRWTEVEAWPAVRDRADRALGSHALSAAAALQLAAAIVLANERPRGRVFITADQRLADAASAEGFDVIVPR